MGGQRGGGTNDGRDCGRRLGQGFSRGAPINNDRKRQRHVSNPNSGQFDNGCRELHWLSQRNTMSLKRGGESVLPKSLS